jgi:hypothetical protein
MWIYILIVVRGLYNLTFSGLIIKRSGNQPNINKGLARFPPIPLQNTPALREEHRLRVLCTIFGRKGVEVIGETYKICTLRQIVLG